MAVVQALMRARSGSAHTCLTFLPTPYFQSLLAKSPSNSDYNAYAAEDIISFDGSRSYGCTSTTMFESPLAHNHMKSVKLIVTYVCQIIP